MIQFLLLLFVCLFLCPAVVFTWAYYSSNFSEEYLKSRLNFDTELTGFERLANVKFDESGSPSTGCEYGLYLGAVDKWQDCKLNCKSYDYEYYFIDSANIHVNNRRLRGAYCLPKAVTKCNLNTSIATIGLDGYKCLSNFPELLGGPSGNEIIGCKSRKLKDNMFNSIYTDFIPPNLVVNNVDELFDGKYRFECVMQPNHIALPAELGSRFETDLNLCGLMDDNKGKFDSATGKCKCDNYIGNDENSMCTDCTSGWSVGTPYNAHGTNYAFTIGRDCSHPDTASNNISQFVRIPCGISTLSAMQANPDKKPCEKGLVYATNTYTPPALENMFG